MVAFVAMLSTSCNKECVCVTKKDGKKIQKEIFYKESGIDADYCKDDSWTSLTGAEYEIKCK